jgi:outer membrane protein OmpA-like peptidoglycan-associated protein
MKHHRLFLTGVAVVSSGLAIAACSSSPPPQNANLNQARQTCASAQSDPTVVQYAQNEMSNAKDALSTAQKAWTDNDDKSKVDHYAYLANVYCETAQEHGKFRVAATQVAVEARTMTLGDTLFATGKADLNAGGKKAVDEVASFMRGYPASVVNITGYTDSVGSAKSNIELSQRRAAAVQQALIADGIDASRIQTQGMGEAHPVASNSTAAGRQKNRRVEVAISGQQPTASGTSAPQQ